MNKGYWQTLRQNELLPSGKTLMRRVLDYVRIWSNRCYSNGIPDDIPATLAATNRAPSWKAVAVAILKNDHHLYSIGFSRPESAQVDRLHADLLRRESLQMDLFEDNRKSNYADT